MNILEALDDPSLFGPHFRGPSWKPCYYDFQLESAPNGGWSTHPGGRFDYAAPLFELDISIGAADQHGTLGKGPIYVLDPMLDPIELPRHSYPFVLFHELLR